MSTIDKQDSRRHRRPLDLAIYFITFALGVTTVAATGHALVMRNNEVGFASRAAAARGIQLIISTNSLTQPGYALCAAAGATLVNALTLFLLSFKLPRGLQKFVWFLPLAAAFNFLFLLATCIAVFHAAKTGHLSVYGTLNGRVLPESILRASAAQVGLSDHFWDKGYVKFMAIISVPTTLFALFTAILAYRFWKREQAETRSALQFSEGQTRPSDVSITEKGHAQHVDRV